MESFECQKIQYIMLSSIKENLKFWIALCHVNMLLQMIFIVKCFIFQTLSN